MNIKNLREQIDIIDDQIIELLEKRFELIKQIAPYKEHLTDEKRENEILKKINNPFIQDIYREIFKNSKYLMSLKK